MRAAKISALSAQRDDWTRKAVDACVAAAMGVVGDTGPIRPGVPIGQLANHEWSWICSSVVWAWISSRSTQAANEGWNPEATIGLTGLTPDPRMAGAVASILPRLAEACSELDWSKPVGDWAKADVIEFLTAASDLIQQALVARDAGERSNADVAARKMNVAAGNPRMTKDEFGDSCPF